MYSFEREQIKIIQQKAINHLGQPMKYKQLCEIVSGTGHIREVQKEGTWAYLRIL